MPKCCNCSPALAGAERLASLRPFGSAYALYAPAGTPAGKIDEWAAAMKKVLAMADVRGRLTHIGDTPIDGTAAAEVRANERRMSEQWAPIVKATGFKGD